MLKKFFFSELPKEPSTLSRWSHHAAVSAEQLRARGHVRLLPAGGHGTSREAVPLVEEVSHLHADSAVRHYLPTFHAGGWTAKKRIIQSS